VKHRVLSPSSLCSDVEKYLQQVSHQMYLIHAAMLGRPEGSPPSAERLAHDERSWPFQVARQFFDTLAKTLAQRADAMLRA
jgi:hypothetical protein